ncbi:IclR family transcriptional regulator domain-containing protein [Parasphingorhabdus pacifica]
MAERDEHFVKALERGLEVLRAFSADRRFLTLSEVARATDLTLPVARRFLQTLVDLGYLRHDDQHFTPTTRVLELGNSFLDSLPLSRIALPHLRDLAAELRVMTSVAVLFDNDVYYVAQAPGRMVMSADIPVGSRYPAHATSVGKVLLAGLPFDDLRTRLDSPRLSSLTQYTITTRKRLLAEIEQVRDQGWVVCDGELEEGMRGVAVPIRDRQARVIAALNVTLHIDDSPQATPREHLVPTLVSTAHRIEAGLPTSAAAG